MNIHKGYCLLTALCLALITGGFAQGTNITMWQVDYSHTGNNSSETLLNPANVGTPGSFGSLFTQALDGYCFGQPLYMSGLTVNGATHNVVYVCTEHDSI